jgi:hypothetical protein
MKPGEGSVSTDRDPSSGASRHLLPQGRRKKWQLRLVLRLTISGDRIAAVDAIADAERLAGFDVEML